MRLCGRHTHKIVLRIQKLFQISVTTEVSELKPVALSPKIMIMPAPGHPQLKLSLLKLSLTISTTQPYITGKGKGEKWGLQRHYDHLSPPLPCFSSSSSSSPTSRPRHMPSSFLVPTPEYHRLRPWRSVGGLSRGAPPLFFRILITLIFGQAPNSRMQTKTALRDGSTKT